LNIKSPTSTSVYFKEVELFGHKLKRTPMNTKRFATYSSNANEIDTMEWAEISRIRAPLRLQPKQLVQRRLDVRCNKECNSSNDGE